MRKIFGWLTGLTAALLLCGCSLFAGSSPSAEILADTVFTVADRQVSLAEWYLYAVPIRAEYEGIYGEEIWERPADDSGSVMADAVKEEIREMITYIKIVSDRAEELGITLNEDELLELNLRTDDYMTSLGEDAGEYYGITREDVYGVYLDNMLALKVYEELTFNVDMTVPDREVRHMVLQYVMIPKTYEDRRGNVVSYSDDELLMMRESARGRVMILRETPGVTLADAVAENYVPIEIVADIEGLYDKLPDELAEEAFTMNDGQISDVFETDEAFYILDCVKRTESVTTDAAAREVIEARQKALFEEEYEKWESQTLFKYNYPVWDALK